MIKKSLCACLFLLGLNEAHTMGRKLDHHQAVEEAIQTYGRRAQPHLLHSFHEAKVQYPPARIALLAFKKERTIELWASNEDKKWHHIRNYPLTAFSGALGPKLRQGDGQIPEGIYHLTELNPFSQFHLSMMIDYPNAFDRAHAKEEGRQRLGGDIYLHGKALSQGCLAVGDSAIDELFLLAHHVGLSHIQMVIAPNDLREGKPATSMGMQPKWVPELYKKIKHSLLAFKEK